MGRLSFAIAGSLYFLTACGGSQPPVESAPPSGETPTAAPEAPAPPPNKPFHDLTQQEKLAVMKDVVVPTMKPLFQAHDPEKFKDFGCVTCHGPNAKNGKFDMPNPELPKLNYADNLKEHQEKTPAMLTFMAEKVKPEMTRLLNEPPFDPATGKGFGCGECHLAK
jgi:hypothetical protein